MSKFKRIAIRPRSTTRSASLICHLTACEMHSARQRIRACNSQPAGPSLQLKGRAPLLIKHSRSPGFDTLPLCNQDQHTVTCRCSLRSGKKRLPLLLLLLFCTVINAEFILPLLPPCSSWVYYCLSLSLIVVVFSRAAGGGGITMFGWYFMADPSCYQLER